MYRPTPECYSNRSLQPKLVEEAEHNMSTSSIIQATHTRSKVIYSSHCPCSSRQGPGLLNSN
jgi:hypothetical protein